MKIFIKKLTVFIKALAKKNKTAQLKWNGSKTDLMEVIYTLYLSEQIKNSSGQKATLREISMTVYDLFGLDAPQNPSRVVSSLKQRVDPVKLSIFCKALTDLYPGFLKCLK